MSEESLLSFPCQFPIKVMGRCGIELEAEITTIVRRHVPDLGEAAITMRESKQGNYLALTVNITATSQEQLDNLYRELSACELTLMVL
ncbi:MAG: DUF493 domain-containing protein [Gammaproteobacteria bacterium]|nr:DUF493 domain-containing protein [Gammaproteobacteria bacterium]MDH5778513.1 DUF493 domain-containing protein [Gammaproteobacteria bacterium]